MSSLASSTNKGVDTVPPTELRDVIRVVLKEELHVVVHECIGDLQTQQTSLKEQQAVCTETMIQHMDRIHATLARFENKMMLGIHMDPHENGGSIEHILGPSSETAESEPEEDETKLVTSPSDPEAVVRASRLNRTHAHQFTQEFLDDLHHFKAETEEEEMEELEEEKDLKFKRALVRKIPNQTIATCLKRFFDFLEEFKEPERTGCPAKIEQSRPFYLCSLVFIVADQLVTISATNQAAATLETNGPRVYHLAESIFLAWFAFELCLRLFVHRLYFFILGHWLMNWLDLFLVAYSAFEQIGISLSFMRALRIFKLAKVVRLLKALKEVRDLRVMLDCLLSSWFALFWAAVLVGFITYMFALIFVQSITQYRIENQDKLDQKLEQLVMARFSSVQQAVISLSKTFFGGFDWGEMFDLLVKIGPISSSLGVFFALFFSISVWNIVGSIFVEKVMDTAKPHPHEVLADARIQAHFDYIAMRQFFDHLDADCDGGITPKEWRLIVEQGGLQEFLALRDVDLRDNADINAFFALAQHEHKSTDPDSAKAGEVPKEALMRVFLKVKGQASKLQVEIMLHELRTRQRQIMKVLGLLRQRQLLTNECVSSEGKTLHGPTLFSNI